MRNLRNIHRVTRSCPDGQFLSASGWDVGTNSIICAYGPTARDPLIQLKRWHTIRSGEPDDLEDIASWDAPCPLPDLECDQVLSLRHFSDLSSTCLVLAGGDIVVVRESPSDGEEKIEIVGSADVAITAAAWSPDEELLAITTRGDTLLFMTREFDNVSNVPLTTEDLKASKHVSVGWGKKETQFKGKGAKALRDPTMPEKVDEGIRSPQDDGSTTISWRGDGAYVAVNSLRASQRRVIRVYSREGLLDGVSEPVDNLEAALSWRPAGNLLAGVQRLEDRIDIVFFERNGLRHGEFPLRLSKNETISGVPAISLRWNFDSSVLAVCFLDKIQLWTMGNYHYYLKQEIHFATISRSQMPVAVEWHPEQPFTFIVGREDGPHRLKYVSQVVSGPTTPPADYGIVAVVDGRYLNLTPFRVANVPPPMALQKIEVENNIVDASIFGGGADTLVAVLESSMLSIYRWDLSAKLSATPSALATISLGPFISRIYVQQVVILNESKILVLASDRSESVLHTFRLVSASLEHVQSSRCPFLASIVTTATRGSATTYRHYFASGEVSADPAVFDSETPGLGNMETALTVFPKQTSEVRIIDIHSRSIQQRLRIPAETMNETIAFGLTPNGSLFANRRRMAKDCTSFVVTPAHLIYTTSQHYLKLVHMTTVEELEVPPDTPEVDERCRSIERGAKLVTAIPSISAVILQMPRGNLETIYPRALVLAGIRQNINNKKYKKAFLACRSHRVDMNILHDHAPEEFLFNVSLFVNQVEKVEHIDLFLSQLREEDVSETMYKDTDPVQAQDDSSKIVEHARKGSANLASSKINRICDAFLQVLRGRMSTNLQNVITSHLCKAPPDLDAGLLEVAKLWKSNPDEAEKAVEHICFLADVNRLYDHALGLYNLDLTLLVAQQSQKDPREYLPFLQSLQELPLFRRSFTIDNILGRHVKALGHLHAMAEYSEFNEYTVKHDLYQQALHLCRYNEEQINQIMRLYAGHLSREGRHKEAGIAYEYLKDYTPASEAYRVAHLWREALACASLTPLEDDQMEVFARRIESSLLQLKDYHSAATIFADYLHDIETAARLFCKGYFFADAIRILSLNKRPDLIDTIVDTGLAEGLGTMTELLAECKAQLNAQVPRLRELRIKKAEEPLAFYDGDVNEGVDIPDNISLAATDASTTGGSLFTRYTNNTGTVGTNATRRTSKNRKREERKRARGKKGSVYEEEYLVNSIGRLIDRVNSVGDEVGRLVVGLMRRGMRERAMAAQAAMTGVIELCKGCVEEVFESGKSSGQEVKTAAEEEGNRPKGGDEAFWDGAESSEARRAAPPIRDFEILSLLGS